MKNKDVKAGIIRATLIIHLPRTADIVPIENKDVEIISLHH